MTDTQPFSTHPPKTALVIGGGIVGIATALYLQRLGVKTTLIERTAIGAGASFGNACMVTNTSITPVATPGLTKKIPFYLTHKDSPLRVTTGFILHNFSWFFNFWRGGNHKNLQYRSECLNLLLCDAYDQHKKLAQGTTASKYLAHRPTLTPFLSDTTRNADRTVWDIRKKLCSGITQLDDTDLRTAMPALNPKWQKSYLMSDYGTVLCAESYLQHLTNAFMDLGGKVIYSPVLGFKTSGRTVQSIITNHGIITADCTALCAGVYSHKLSAQLGDTVPLMAESGYHMEIRNPNITIKYNILSGAHSMAITNVNNGLRCTIFAEYAGLGATPKYEEAERMIHKNLADLLPDLQVKNYTLWRGDRPSTSDSLPIIGTASQYDNMFYGFGHQHIGMSSGPKTGRILADIMYGTPPSINISGFDVRRFK